MNSSDVSNRSDFQGWKGPMWGLLVVWLVTVLTAAYFGIFDAFSPHSMSVPIALGVAAVLPVVVFAVWFRTSARFRAFALSLDPVVLTAVQSWRAGGIVFLILMAKGLLPSMFAVPAGLGDMAIGLSAPFVARAMWRGNISADGVRRWQRAGILDLVVAVTMGVLCAPGKTGILAHGTTTLLMGLLPMSLIPTFAVPLLVIFHLICIAQLRQENRQSWGGRAVVAG
jgi:hypothetical protein